MGRRPLRVWWIPQIPGAAFHVEVGSVEQAKFLLKTLADYDAFQLEHRIKPEYANTGGLEVYEEGRWMEWQDEDGYSLDDLMRKEQEPQCPGSNRPSSPDCPTKRG